VATAAGFALSAAGRRRRDAHVASPGVLVGMNGVVALTGAGTLPVGGAILVLAAFPGVASVRRIDRLLVLQGLLMAGVVRSV
jgi:hypothetical protein